MRPRALDLFCKAGGVSAGLVQAGFDVTGVDIEAQPRYPFRFIQADALAVNLDRFDFIWASPPCQKYSRSTKQWRDRGYEYSDLIEATREGLRRSEKPYIIENVVGAPLHEPVMLCGIMFGLGVIRHRMFESNLQLIPPVHFKHRTWNTLENGGPYVSCAGNGNEAVQVWRDAMGINWMTRKELAQAIPPAYSRYLGDQVIKSLNSSTQMDSQAQLSSAGNALAGVSRDSDGTSVSPCECLSWRDPAQGGGTESPSLAATRDSAAMPVAGSV